MGIGLQTRDDRHHEIGGECKIYSIAPKQLLVGKAMFGYATHIRFHHRQYMRGGVQRHDHMLSDLFSYGGMFNQLIACGSDHGRWTIDNPLWCLVYSLLTTFHKIQDIILCDTTVQPCALYLL